MTHQISIAEANSLIATFLANKTDILSGAFSDADPFTNSQTFEMSSVLSMLGQHGTTQMRCYFGMYGDSESIPTEKRGKIVLVLCSVDVDGNDLNLAPEIEDSTAIILEDAIMCPPYCSATSQINNL